MARRQKDVAFGDRLRWLRDLTGLSARAVDRLVTGEDGPGAYTSMLEAGVRSNPRTDTLTRYAGAFGVSLDWLVSGKGAAPNPDDVRRAVAKAGAR